VPLPTLHPGHDPTTTPALWNLSGKGVSGGVSSLTPNPIRAGVNIAFGSSANAEVPLWQLLNELGPT